MSTINSTKRRSPYRRVKAISFLMIAAPLLAWESLNSVWYIMSFEAPSVVVSKTFATVNDVSATSYFTGWDLVQPGTAATIHGPIQAMNLFYGLPTPLVLITAGVILAIFGAIIKSSLVTLLASVPLYFSHHVLGTTRALVEDPNFGGTYMFPQIGLARFSFVTMIAIMVSLSLTFMVFISNRNDRKSKIEAGQKVEPSLLDLLGAYNSRILNTAEDMQQRSNRSENITTR